VLRIRLQPLIGILTERAHIRQTERAQRLEPLIEQVVDQTLTQHDPAALIEPRLADIQHQQYGCQLREHAQLPEE